MERETRSVRRTTGIILLALMILQPTTVGFSAYAQTTQDSTDSSDAGAQLDAMDAGTQQEIDDLNGQVKTKQGNVQQLDSVIGNYQKKIDDFAIIFVKHKIASNVFSLLEQLTLPNVWFYSISVNDDTASIQLSGETETKEILTQQIAVFEASEFITNVSNLSSGITDSGRLKFNLSLSLDPSIYNTDKLSGNNSNQ